MSDYDQDTTRVYVENGGGFCPECDHDEPRVSRPRALGDGMVTLDYECPACRARWLDTYILDTVQQLRPGKHADQGDMFSRGQHQTC